MLEVLWELAHLPTLPTSLVQQALEEHLGILSDAYAVKETVKRSYIIKCIEDIKKVRQTCHRLLSIVFVGMRAVVYCSVLRGHSNLSLKSEYTFFILFFTLGKTGLFIAHV